MNVSILGGCGFIGSYLTEALLKEDFSVTLFDRPNCDLSNISAFKDRVKFVGGDFLNRGDLAAAIEGADVVVHLISATLPGNSMADPIQDLQANTVGSIRLFEECVKARVRKVVFLSSGGTVYGIPDSIPIRESHALNPISPYGVSKAATEKYLGLFSHQYGLDYTVLRFSNPYGRRQSTRTGQGVIASWMERVRYQQPIEIWGDGSAVRDYLRVEDAVEALKLAISKSSEQKVFNVGSGEGHTLLQMYEILEELAGTKIPILFKEIRSSDVPTNVLDVSLIRDVLGWEARTNLRDGMKMMWSQFQP